MSTTKLAETIPFLTPKSVKIPSFLATATEEDFKKLQALHDRMVRDDDEAYACKVRCYNAMKVVWGLATVFAVVVVILLVMVVLLFEWPGTSGASENHTMFACACVFVILVVVSGIFAAISACVRSRHPGDSSFYVFA
jgi:hypothetical protein